MILTSLLLLRKGVYPYEYMDIRDRFNETTLSNKEAFHSELYLEDVTDEKYIHAQKVFKDLVLKNMNIMTYMFKVIYHCLQMYLKILEVY